MVRDDAPLTGGTDGQEVAGRLLDQLERLRAAGASVGSTLSVGETGEVLSIGAGVARVSGLPGVGVDELVRFSNGELGVTADLFEDHVGVTLLTPSGAVAAGSTVTRTGRSLEVPVGPGLLGRVIDPLGNALDGQGEVRSAERLPVERAPTPIHERAPVTRPLRTGLKVIDALFPVGRGQRELIVGDRQTGKSTVALTAILAQRGTGVKCVYCSIGQRGAQVARTVEALHRGGALEYTAVVVAGNHDPAGLRMISPFAATTIGEALMEGGADVLVVYDDLTQHARAYRELSLLLKRPPGREAYPGDVFYLHARLLERATQLSAARGGGSLSALPIAEIQERDLSAYVPTNLISITDGQIVLSPELFARGVLPAVDIGLSVSRVGGKAQLPALRSVAGRLRLDYAQFQELERFARFGADMDDVTRRTLRRGRRIRASFAQDALVTERPGYQVALLLAVGSGLFDELPESEMPALAARIGEELELRHRPLLEELEAGSSLDDTARERLLSVARTVIGGGSQGAGPAAAAAQSAGAGPDPEG